MAGPIEQLKATRWWEPAVRRYAAHLRALSRQNCPELREQFTAFCADVLVTPEEKRDELLRIDEPQATEPSVRYRQYEQPRADEMRIGVDRGREYAGRRK